MEISKTMCKKVNRKQRKLKHIILKETGISCVDHATKYIVIANVGLVNGLSEEIIYNNFAEFGTIVNIALLPGKSCCFLSFQDISAAIKAYECCNGRRILVQNNKPAYLLYAEYIPHVECDKMWNTFPPGLTVLNEFISLEEEHCILQLCDFSKICGEEMKHRKVMHFGYEFLYEINNVNKECPLQQEIPKELDFLWERLYTTNVLQRKFVPNQLTVNYYSPSQGIPHHIDTHSAFEDPIVSLSLQSSVVMEFKKDEQHLCVLLVPRSLCVMSGECRYDWTHGITPRKFDIVKTPNGFNSIQRDTRVSFTFRRILKGNCKCNYKSKCDSFKNAYIENDTALTLEKIHVHDVYEKISSHFSETRHKPWPRVLNFLESFEVGSIIIDVGCGNGKYLDKMENIFKVGCDTSISLLDVCQQKGYEVLAANCLSTFLKDNSVDGVICIAVIHHLATEERRINAIAEIVRILKAHGRALIYVWARDQNKYNVKTNYLKQNCKKDTDDIPKKEADILGLTLPVHTNRTQFTHNDVMVPWKTKDDVRSTYLRFYHVFDENELETLCSKVNGIKILHSYYDQGNWCVILVKNSL